MFNDNSSQQLEKYVHFKDQITQSQTYTIQKKRFSFLLGDIEL